MIKPLLKPAGDSALLLEWDVPVNPELNKHIYGLLLLLEQRKIDGIIETVPAFCSLIIYFDLAITDFWQLSNQINELLLELRHHDLNVVARTVTIPVFYGGQYGPDLEYIAGVKGITPEEVIKLHCSTEYHVYMIGFLPGFPYLGFVDNKIATGRRREARAFVSSGSVGVAGRQSGIYSMASPGGWQIIGRTPIKLFKQDKGEFLLKTGDKVIFKPMGKEIRFNDVNPDAWRELIG